MEATSSARRVWVAAVLAAGCLAAAAQAPEVPVYRQGRQEGQYEAQIQTAARELFAKSNAVGLAVVNEQLKRSACQLQLPSPKTAKLATRELWLLAHTAHFRVGWVFLCNKCNDWHVNLAGGYALTTNGALATCYHVVQPESRMKEGCLIAADENGKVWPVTEVLAANRYSDACIVRLGGAKCSPLSLSTNVYPGDPAFCYSDPLDHRGFFSAGIVNRFYQFPGRRSFSAAPSAAYAPTRIDLSTDWAPGSSGSAVLDQCGNAIGHVSTIAAINETDSSDTQTSPLRAGATMIVFHEAVSARDVLRLIKR